YLSLATGYRFFFEYPDGMTGHAMTSGPELVQLKLGMDLRSGRHAALGVYVASDVDLFVSTESGSSFAGSLGAGRPSLFLSAGLQGRFDVGGVAGKPPRMVAR
ncbi:MAG TPA: hypothetical protein VHB21_12880, partial [Minicystis sp.]|nr:hypothetical protein [Minicystis sp.]